MKLARRPSLPHANPPRQLHLLSVEGDGTMCGVGASDATDHPHKVTCDRCAAWVCYDCAGWGFIEDVDRWEASVREITCDSCLGGGRHEGARTR